METDIGKSELLKRELDQMLVHPKDFGITAEEAGYLKSGAWSKSEIRGMIAKMRQELDLLHRVNQEDKVTKLKKRIDIFDRAVSFME